MRWRSTGKSRQINAFARIRDDRRGAAAIEFAMVSVPFLLIVLGALQVSIIFFAGQALETFAEGVGRNILTGNTQKQNLSATQYKSLLCAQLPVLFQCSNLLVDVTTSASFTSANVTMPTLTFDVNGNVTNSWNYNTGGPGDIVVLRMMYQWPIVGLPSSVSFANQGNGNHLLLATAVFKNEIYN